MFTETLSKNTKNALALLGKSHLLDLRDIAAMKLDAIATRGTKRDFVDLYFICKSGGTSLEEIFSFYDKKYGNLAANVIHIQKSLVYFVDAETEIDREVFLNIILSIIMLLYILFDSA